MTTIKEIKVSSQEEPNPQDMITREESQNASEDELNDVPLDLLDERLARCGDVQREVDDNVLSLDKTERALIAAESYLESLNTIQLNGGLDRDSSRIYNLGIENLQEKLGDYEEYIYVSLEAFNGSSDRTYQTSLALEGLSSKLGKWIEVFWQWMLDLVKTITTALDSLRFVNKYLKSKFSSLLTKVEALPSYSGLLNNPPKPKCTFNVVRDRMAKWFNPCPSIFDGIISLEKFFFTVMGSDGERQYRLTEAYLTATTEAAKVVSVKLMSKGTSGGYKDLERSYASLDSSEKTWLREYKLKCDAIVGDMWKPYKTSSFVIFEKLKQTSSILPLTKINSALRFLDKEKLLAYAQHYKVNQFTVVASILAAGAMVGWGLLKVSKERSKALKPLIEDGTIVPSGISFSSNYDCAVYPKKQDDVLPRDAVFVACHIDFGKFSSGTNISSKLYEVQRLERKFTCIGNLLDDLTETSISQQELKTLEGKVSLPFTKLNKEVLKSLAEAIASSLRVLGATFDNSLTSLNKSCIVAREKLQEFKMSVGDSTANDADYRALAKETKGVVAKLYAPMRAVLVYLMKSYKMAYEGCLKTYEDLVKLKDFA